ncbi:glycosyltransferase family 2 protein [Paenibacillus yanchengensis]|uniref:Glycosyltransferase family 2 protein n=1 Tax=Paenibacillus yanchengensis TaxID=2035833 RepID=A0ABW4YN99_9BACL
MASVIMPVYNGELHLEEAIQSVLNQSYIDFEFIIINDGSTDQSLKIITKYKLMDNRIHVISRDNRGLVSSLNEGIAIAQGKYIIRMDADDICYSDRFEKQVDFLETHQSIDILSSYVTIIGEENVLLENKLNQPLVHPLKQFLTDWYCFCHPAVVMRKSIFKTLIGYQCYFAEDLDLWLRACNEQMQFRKLEVSLLYYRVHHNSKTKQDNQLLNGIKDAVLLKVQYVREKMGILFHTYAVWGAGVGGITTIEIMNEHYPDLICIGLIDTYKKGAHDSIPILTPFEFDFSKADYVLVATEPGKAYAADYLEERELKLLTDYLPVI